MCVCATPFRYAHLLLALPRSTCITVGREMYRVVFDDHATGQVHDSGTISFRDRFDAIRHGLGFVSFAVFLNNDSAF